MSSSAGPSNFGSSAAGPSSLRTGTWQPLPYIHSGIIVHPYHPASPPPTPTKPGETSKAAAYRNRYSSGAASSRGGTGGSDAGSITGFPGPRGKGQDGLNPHEVAVDIGDEIFAFEEYRCSYDEDSRGDLWYRGYVAQSVNLSNLIPSASDDGSTETPRPEPSVLIGIFPASCVYIRHESSSDDVTLTAAYEAAVQKAQQRDVDGQLGRGGRAGGFGDMAVLKEEDEDGSAGQKTPQGNGALTPTGAKSLSPGKGKSPELGASGEVIDITAMAGEKSTVPAQGTPLKRASRPLSLILDKGKLANGDEDKEPPPLPRLTAGDSTLAGQQWPLVDEIACAIRDWYQRLPSYLVNRDYRLFNTVVQHIDALWLGRRQLLSQTLSGDELVRVRRECVSRLVKCNVAQGLEVIVRSLEHGSIMVTDKERAYSGATWISGITAYVYQVQLAYIDLIPLDTLIGKNQNLITPSLPTKSQRFSLEAAKASDPRPGSLVGPKNDPPHNHVFLDVRAFIASPCVPGETVELFFSLYNAKDNRFITEEFCLILNHLGTPARDAESRLGRLRTLYTDLKPDDLAGPVYLVCRIVRNGALKMRPEAQAGTLESQYRQSVAGSRRSGQLLMSEHGTMRGVPSIAESDTDDSFSVTSGYGGQRTTILDTDTNTIAASSVIDGRPTFRRPLGCAVLELPPLPKITGEGGEKFWGGKEFSMPIFVPRDEGGFATLHEAIIAQHTQDVVSSNRAEAIIVSLKLLHGVAQQLVKENPSLLRDVPLASRLSFPDVVPIGISRNDLYVKLWSANFFPVPSSSGGSIRVRRPAVPTNYGNVQVTLEVRKQDGTTVSDVMFSGGTGDPALLHYHSLVFSHNDKPTFGELIKLSLPDHLSDCHLFLTFRSRTRERRSGTADYQELEKPFGYAYLPLISDGSCITDGSHELILYRMDKSLFPTPNLYFTAPSVDDPTSRLPTTLKNMSPLRDRMSVRTYLCSSVYTQDATLQSLFGWQNHLTDIQALSVTLDRFGFVNEEEIAKFVPKVLDSLFGILVANYGDRQEEVDGLVFKALVKVLSMTSDRRFPNFSNVLDEYITTQFNYPSSASNILRTMKAVMSSPQGTEYRSLLKVWHLFFRFIIRSRELDRAKGIGLDATSAHIEADFQRQVKSILGEMNALMKSTDRSVIGTQTLAVQHYADILPYLTQVFPSLEIAEMVITFADSLTYSKGSMALYKLELLLQVVRVIFDSSESRALLVPALIRWVKPHLGKYETTFDLVNEGKSASDARRVKWLECNRLAVTVVAWIISRLQDWLDSPLITDDNALRMQEEDNIEYCLSLVPNLLESYADQRSKETIICLNRQRSQSHIYRRSPDVFPTSHPFGLISELPPLSLLARTNVTAGEDMPPSPGDFQPGLAECTTVIYTLVLATPHPNLSRFFNEMLEIDGAGTTSKILRSILAFCSSTIQFDAFPREWLSLTLMAFSGMVRLLEPLGDLLQTGFVPPLEQMSLFDQPLWTACFELLCDFCGSEELALEEHAPQRRRAEWIIAGDLRDEGASLLMRLWNALGWPAREDDQDPNPRYGAYQTRFTGLAGRILGLCLSSHDQLCETAVEILFSMIYAEYFLKGNFDTISSEIFAKLDTLFLNKAGSPLASSDPTMRAYFVAHLRAVFENSPQVDTSFHSKVGDLLNEIELFIELLLELRDIPESPEWKDERAQAILQLTIFTQRIGREDLYIRFIHQLVKLDIDARDWLAAGLALKMHADLYEWQLDGELLEDFSIGGINLPAQNEFARKESLYYHAIDYFAEAEANETALELCQELVIQHQQKTYHIPKLADLLAYQAKLWERIGSSSRHHPEYFRVVYFGDFTQINKGKDYIVRGQLWQRFSDYCDLLQRKHPQATIHRSKIPPSESVRFGDDQVIWVISVSPEPDVSHPALGETVADNVQSYWRWNDISRFSATRPYVRDQRDSDGVLAWTEKTWLTTAKPLPDLLSRSEVTEVRYEQISPIANALSQIAKATKLLRTLTKGKDGSVDVKQLGTVINGAVDSPVNGGVKLYRKVFLTESYLRSHPTDGAAVTTLRSALIEYVRAIQEALSVHRNVCRDLAFHEALKSHFYKAFPDEIAALPAWSDSSHSSHDASMSPRMNGHMAHASISTIPANSLPLPANPARMSTISMSSEIGYILPQLRVGPSYQPPVPTTPVTQGSGSHGSQMVTPALTLSSPDHTGSPSVPTTSSSPRQSTLSSKRRSHSPKLPAQDGGVPTLGNRALSIVGSLAGRSRTSLSVLSEGTVGEISEMEGPDGVVIDVTPGPDGSGGGTKKLGRFGSFMRRKS